MKNVLFWVVVIAVIVTVVVVHSNYEPKPFSGFVVCKEYTPAHMSDQTPRIVRQAVVVVPRPVYFRRSKPHKIGSSWVIYVANETGVRRHNVDSVSYNRVELGSRFTIHPKQ